MKLVAVALDYDGTLTLNGRWSRTMVDAMVGDALAQATRARYEFRTWTAAELQQTKADFQRTVK